MLVGNTSGGRLLVENTNNGSTIEISIHANAYQYGGPWTAKLKEKADFRKTWTLKDSGNWYDFSIGIKGNSGYLRRFAGRVETSKHTISDPAMALNIQS